MRSRSDSNRCRWFCRPLPSHSATRPYFLRRTNVQFQLKMTIYSSTITETYLTSPSIGGFSLLYCQPYI